ncbi:hypothetical protein [Rubritalea marina]|uniref:hypothetical protein n=1 Tax=Rubritalea marina TaxID=361055 RepID=UPI000365B264|nr:hypothetical protein [Rubritalea marina]
MRVSLLKAPLLRHSGILCLALNLISCSTPEQTARATKGSLAGAGVGGLMGGWSGAATGAAVTGLLGAATATGDPSYGRYPSAGTPTRSTSGSTNSRSTGSMQYRF